MRKKDKKEKSVRVMRRRSNLQKEGKSDNEKLCSEKETNENEKKRKEYERD